MVAFRSRGKPCNAIDCPHKDEIQPWRNFNRYRRSGKWRYEGYCKTCEGVGLCPRDIDLDYALRVAIEDGRLDFDGRINRMFECPICGMHGDGPWCVSAEEDCALAVADGRLNDYGTIRGEDSED